MIANSENGSWHFIREQFMLSIAYMFGNLVDSDQNIFTETIFNAKIIPDKEHLIGGFKKVGFKVSKTKQTNLHREKLQAGVLKLAICSVIIMTQ